MQEELRRLPRLVCRCIWLLSAVRPLDRAQLPESGRKLVRGYLSEIEPEHRSVPRRIPRSAGGADASCFPVRG